MEITASANVPKLAHVASGWVLESPIKDSMA
jgi:hypothetical protein